MTDTSLFGSLPAILLPLRLLDFRKTSGVASNGRVGIGTVPNNNTTLDMKGAGASVIRLNAVTPNASYTDLRHNQTGKYFEITPSSAFQSIIHCQHPKW